MCTLLCVCCMCVCVCACVRACVRACVCACVRVLPSIQIDIWYSLVIVSLYCYTAELPPLTSADQISSSQNQHTLLPSETQRGCNSIACVTMLVTSLFFGIITSKLLNTLYCIITCYTQM